jgi:hypothetical protein
VSSLTHSEEPRSTAEQARGERALLVSCLNHVAPHRRCAIETAIAPSPILGYAWITITGRQSNVGYMCTMEGLPLPVVYMALSIGTG